MRIVFMGTPDFAVATLRALLDNGQQVVGVITAPDKPAGRGRKLRQSAVKEFATRHNLPVMQPTNLKDTQFLHELKGLKPDLQVVVAFRMLPQAIWQLPTKGTVNLHASLLPQYRGAAPINWAIINGEEKTGVTTFFINENIDTGDLIMQDEIGIDPHDTAGSLHDKLMLIGASLMVKTVQALQAGAVPSQKQPHTDQLKVAPKIFKEDTHINFNQPVESVYNFIRGMSPYPCAKAFLNQNDDKIPVKIYEVVPQPGQPHLAPGGVLCNGKDQLAIACTNGWINVKTLQLAGKKTMTINALLNGTNIQKDAKFS